MGVITSLPAFTQQPEGISFAREGATFEWNFNYEIQPIMISIWFADLPSWGDTIIKIDQQTFTFSTTSISDFDSKVKADASLSALISCSWNESGFAIYAKTTAVHSMSLSIGKMTRTGKLSSNISAAPELFLNGKYFARCIVSPVNCFYKTNVAGLLPSSAPELPTASTVNSYPYGFKIVPRISGVNDIPIVSNNCYGWSTIRPRGLQRAVDYINMLVNLAGAPCQPDQLVYVHYLCQTAGDYVCKANLVKHDATTEIVTIATVKAVAMQTVSYVIDFTKVLKADTSVVEVWIEKDASKLGVSAYYYIMPKIERRRFISIRNLFGLYESLVSLLPGSSGFEFESEQMLLSDGSTGIRNSNPEEVCELSVDMLNANQARILSSLLGMHGEFILTDVDGFIYRCLVNAKSIEACNDDDHMQTVKIKYKIV